MGASPAVGPVSREQRAANEAYGEFVRLAKRVGVMSEGHHNRNYELPLTETMARLLGLDAGSRVVVRVRRSDALPVVVRTWTEEPKVLSALEGVLPGAPKCLAKRDKFAKSDQWAIHSHVEGVPLSSACPNGKPVEMFVVRALADVLAQLSQVRRDALPALPEAWPRNDKDSQGFLRTLVGLADRQIRQPNWSAYGGLFAALGIPEDALRRLAERVPAMSRRPYSLLHADLHRDNVMLTRDGDPPLTCIDWELASYGDPLHDLATHLVRMRYPEFQWADVVGAWATAMQSTRPAAANGLARDLRHYIAFEQAQSVFPDVIRAAKSLKLDDSCDQKGRQRDEKRLQAATADVSRALQAATEPLGLTSVPGELEIEHVLYRWQASWREHHGKSVVSWTPDGRFKGDPGFPHAAVRHALIGEGAAPAGRVFKGTAHLNSVVRVPGFDLPVVVRRKIASVRRSEPRFLSEHAVLRAIEKSEVAVTAPRVLALGESHPGDLFTIHTYVGPSDGEQPPSHPVLGLLPHEADALVDQLGSLTGVDFSELDPMAGRMDFYGWLSDQLMCMVDQLPTESKRLARAMGLPDALRLREILSRHQVTRREPALLHGDLNPWNLVRRDDRFALTIIDWEMAMVGDPLYDMVRHMHLSPARPGIRDRMFRRWESVLPAKHTKDWQQDWRVYRWIEIVRSAYVDLDRLVTGASLDAPNVRRAVESYAMTLKAATASLGLPSRRPSRSDDVSGGGSDRWARATGPSHASSLRSSAASSPPTPVSQWPHELRSRDRVETPR